jgi:aminoglycoside phosphotransferase family enzyme/predicted kinase
MGGESRTRQAASLRELVDALRSPDAYPHAVDGVEVVQTHASYVLLAGDHAYKIKKPLDLGFLDYSTLEKRRSMCEEEVRLNRRLCSDVYLGVAPITRDGGTYRLGGDGEAIEYAVHMRRVPRARMLDAMLDRGEATAAVVRHVAREMAAFHARAATDTRISSFGRAEALRRNWDENFEQTAPFAGALLAEEPLAAVRSYVEAFLSGQVPLLEERAHGGRVRDCHGDLRSDAVYVREDGGICVMDCIEFNDRIRYGDVAGDIGFLAMDLEYRGHRELSDELMGAYLGDARDDTLPLVLRHYKAYRAFVRGKVEVMRSAEAEVPEPARAAARDAARRYFGLAASYVRDEHPQWLLYSVGLSGSGKTYLADALACRIGAVVLSTDVVRRGMAAAEPGANNKQQPAAYGAGRYAEDERERVYERMRGLAREHLALGRGVILDATHIARSSREAVRALGRERGVPVLGVEVVASDALVRERIARRAEEGASASEATWEIYAEQKRRLEPVGPDEGVVVAVDAGRRLTSNLDAVVERMKTRSLSKSQK